MVPTRAACAARAGFTLLETAVVAVLTACVLVLALPSYSNYLSNQRLGAGARVLVSDLGIARQEAVTRRARITVSFTATDPTCGDRSEAASYTLAQGPILIKRTCLAHDVEWSPVPDGQLIFRSVGIPQSGMTLAIRSTRTSVRHSVTVSADTGVIDVEP